MRAFNLKQESPGKYRSNSPLRPASNSMAFSLKIDDDEHGAWKDFASEESGSLYELAALLGIAVTDGKLPVQDSKRAYSGLQDYARSHGIPAEALRSAHWFETTKDNRRALQFQTMSGKRWRFLDGDKPVYKSEQGYKRCWYGLNDATKVRIADGLPLVLCNGEISTVVGQYHGLAAACVTSGENELSDELLAEMRAFLFESQATNIKIIVAMDCDSKGRHVARGIESQLRSAGMNAQAVDLGLGHAGDLADFCSLHTTDSLAAIEALPALPDEAPAPVTTDYRFYSLDEVLKLPPVEWLIPGIVPARGLTIVYGHSGAGKSFYTLDLALNLALDQPVVYVVAEGEGGTPARVGAWMKHYQKRPRHVTFCLGVVNLFYDDDLQYFRDQAERFNPVMMVIDTLAMCSSGADENNSMDMQRIVASCKTLSRTLSSAVVLVHHTNKQNTMRGSTSLYNSSDSAVQLTKLADEIQVTQRKSKDSHEFPVQYLLPVTIDLGYTNHAGEPVSSLVLLPSEKVSHDADELLTENQLQVIRAILVDPSASLADLSITADMSRSAVSGVIYRLMQRGLVSSSDGQRCLTAEGEAAFNKSTDSGDSGDSGGVSASNGASHPERRESPESPESPSQQGVLPGLPGTQTGRQHYEN